MNCCKCTILALYFRPILMFFKNKNSKKKCSQTLKFINKCYMLKEPPVYIQIYSNNNMFIIVNLLFDKNTEAYNLLQKLLKGINDSNF